jgi:Xaa-Pro aminopeptidase
MTQIRGTEDFPGDYTCKPPNAPTGKWAKAPHLAWADDVHRVGEVTNLELGGCRYRYHAPLSRTVYLGTPPGEMLDTAKVVVEGLNAALDAVKPGSGLVAGHRQVRYRQGLAHRLPGRNRLSANLGRANGEPASGRQNGARGKYDAPLHPRDLEGRVVGSD